MSQHIDAVAKQSDIDTLNSNLTLMAPAHDANENVADITTSGTYVNYTVSSDGLYTVYVTMGGGSDAKCLSRIAIGNSLIINVWANLSQYNSLLPTPIFLRAGTVIKALAIFPSHAAAKLVRIK